MRWFGKRAERFDSKHAQDGELKYLILARRNELLAETVADLLDIKGVVRTRYVKVFLHFATARPGDDVLFRKLRADFDAKKVRISGFRIRRLMQQHLDQAAAEIREAA